MKKPKLKLKNNAKDNKTRSDLIGKLLLATPSISDTRFTRGLIYVCAHDEHGVMGLVINQPLPDLEFTNLIGQLGIKSDIEVKLPVMHGGPVEPQRGFLLHSPEFRQDETIDVDIGFSITGTTNALERIANGDAPDQALFILGYAGWQAGQLEAELQQNAWLIADPDPDLVFSNQHEGKWNKALDALGVDPGMLSNTTGTA